MRLTRVVALSLFVVGAIASCGGSDDVRIDAFPNGPSPSPGSGEGPVGAGDTPPRAPGTSADAGANRDAGALPPDPSGEAGVSPPGCPPLSDTPANGARWAIARQSTKPKTLDGDFSDYDGCVTVLVDTTTAARVKGTPAASAKIFIEWEPSALWIAAEIADPKLEGSNPIRPYMNDSLEVYLSPAGLRTGDYGPHDRQLIIDHKGLSLHYPRYPRNGLPELYSDARAYVTPGGWRVEMRVDAVTMLGAPLAKGDVRFFDVMLTDGVRQSDFLIWAMQPHAACTCARCDCNRSPAYDTLLFAPITLE